ncbi:MAG: ABC transporter permease subunit [Planctomycetaceae bacterium]
MRSGYIALFAVLAWTAVHATFGNKGVESLSDWATFGRYLFGVMAIVQLVMVTAASLLFSIGVIAQEKDRRTLLLLLMTDLKSRELVLGKLLGSLLPVLVLVGLSIPVFCLIRLLGGITLEQVLWSEALCVVTALVVGSWGTLVAYWREKTFQTLAIGVLGVVLLIGVAEGTVSLLGLESGVGRIAALLNPFRGLIDLLNPLSDRLSLEGGAPVPPWHPIVALGVLALLLIVVTSVMVRRWNPSQAVHEQGRRMKEEHVVAERSRHRVVWEWPILWREIATGAYGRKMLFIKLVYLAIAVALFVWVRQPVFSEELVLGMLPRPAAAFVSLTIIGLLLVTAQSVTSLTSEQDGQTLELLLVTEVTAKEFIFGKLFGVLYNTKEVLVVPLLMLLMFRYEGGLSREDLLFLVIGFGSLTSFCAALGLHMALSHDSSRQAILNSLGTVFFLFAGIFICLMLIVDARQSFGLQLQVFGLFSGGGALALILLLTRKNASSALMLCGLLLPFLTFYSTVGFLQGDTGAVCAAVFCAYAFTTVAMLVPAISEFDHALGRARMDRG